MEKRHRFFSKFLKTFHNSSAQSKSIKVAGSIEANPRSFHLIAWYLRNRRHSNQTFFSIIHSLKLKLKIYRETKHRIPRNQPIKMRNTSIIWLLASLLMSICMTGEELSIFVTTQGRYPLHMDVKSDWSVGQVVRQATAEKGLTGSWKLRIGDETLSEETAVADSGICAESQVDLIPHWDLASLELKQPIFRVTFENPELKAECGVSKLDLFVQYVRGQDIHDTQNRKFLDQWSGSSKDGQRMIEFRILTASAEKNDFFLFDAKAVPYLMAEELILLPGGTFLFSPTQVDMARLKLLTRDFLRWSNLYFPFFDTKLKDVKLPFDQPLPLFYRNEHHRMLVKKSLVTFEEAVFGSGAVSDVRKMEKQDFYNAGWAIRSEVELKRQWKLAKGIPARIGVQIDAFIFIHRENTAMRTTHPTDPRSIALEVSNGIWGLDNWKLPIAFQLEFRPGATFKSFTEVLRSHILNKMMHKLPTYWRRNGFRAANPEDIFLSATPGTDSETVRELQRESIGLELEGNENISTGRYGNDAFFFRPDKRKEFVHVVFSAKHWTSI